jgi:hypothetical protein
MCVGNIAIWFPDVTAIPPEVAKIFPAARRRMAAPSPSAPSTMEVNGMDARKGAPRDARSRLGSLRRGNSRGVEHASACRYATEQHSPTGSERDVHESFFDAQFRMYVLPIQHVLEELDHGHCQFQVYEELKSQDKLVAWESGMKVIFVSQVWLKHDWLDDDHASKFKLLCEVLKDIRAGDFDVQPEFSSAMNKNADKLAFRGADLRRDLSEGYLWIDVCCIPQKSKKKQLPAISSIPNYVASCDYFLVLAGPWVHERGHRCDLNSWMGRGWCRMEQLCNALSPKSKPIIVVRTRQLRSALPPGGQHFRDWLCCPVGLGGFTVRPLVESGLHPA